MKSKYKLHDLTPTFLMQYFRNSKNDAKIIDDILFVGNTFINFLSILYCAID